MNIAPRTALTGLALLVGCQSLLAHAGPPFPIVTGAMRGPYAISIWTDPDATDNGMPGGQFWVVIETSSKGGSIPADTRATVTARPQGAVRPAGAQPVADPLLTARATPVRGDVTNQFAALVLSHEGPYDVRVDVSGPLGQATVDTTIEATYDLRPPPYMLVWYLGPFVIAGVLWTRLLLRRRGLARRSV